MGYFKIGWADRNRPMEDGSLSFRPNLSFKLMWIVYLTAASVVGFFFCCYFVVLCECTDSVPSRWLYGSAVKVLISFRSLKRVDESTYRLSQPFGRRLSLIFKKPVISPMPYTVCFERVGFPQDLGFVLCLCTLGINPSRWSALCLQDNLCSVI